MPNSQALILTLPVQQISRAVHVAALFVRAATAGGVFARVIFGQAALGGSVKKPAGGVAAGVELWHP